MIFYVKIELKSKLHITDCDGSITHDKLYWTSKIKFFKDKKPIFKKIESYREEEKKKKKLPLDAKVRAFIQSQTLSIC